VIFVRLTTVLSVMQLDVVTFVFGGVAQYLMQWSFTWAWIQFLLKLQQVVMPCNQNSL